MIPLRKLPFSWLRLKQRTQHLWKIMIRCRSRFCLTLRKSNFEALFPSFLNREKSDIVLLTLFRHRTIRTDQIFELIFDFLLVLLQFIFLFWQFNFDCIYWLHCWSPRQVLSVSQLKLFFCLLASSILLNQWSLTFNHQVLLSITLNNLCLILLVT